MEEQNNGDLIAQYLEKDAEVLKENGLHVQPKPSEAGSVKGHYWKFVGGFFVLLLLGFIGIPFIGKYMQAQADKAQQEQYAASDRYMHDLQERLKNDTDGGATPEETLQLFITALKKNDIEQAEKYFVIYPEDKQVSLVGIIKKLQDAGEMEKFIEYLGKVKQEKGDGILDGNVTFSYVNKDGKMDIGIEITKSKYSTVWKIENLYL